MISKSEKVDGHPAFIELLFNEISNRAREITHYNDSRYKLSKNVMTRIARLYLQDAAELYANENNHKIVQRNQIELINNAESLYFSRIIDIDSVHAPSEFLIPFSIICKS